MEKVRTMLIRQLEEGKAALEAVLKDDVKPIYDESGNVEAHVNFAYETIQTRAEELASTIRFAEKVTPPIENLDKYRNAGSEYGSLSIGLGVAA